MEPLAAIEQQMTQTKDELQIIAQEILSKVHEICCFGSDNKPAGKIVGEVYYGIINKGELLAKAALSASLSNQSNKSSQTITQEKTTTDLSLTVSSRMFSSVPVPADDLTAEQREINIQLIKLLTIYRLKANDGSIPVSLQQFMENKKGFIALAKAYFTQEKKTGGFTTDKATLKKYLPVYLARHFQKFISHRAFIRFRESASKQQYSNFESIALKDKKLMEKYYDPGIEPYRQNDRTYFFTKACSDIKGNHIVEEDGAALLFGYSNCGGMTDIAFLEAIYRNLPYQITYVRFINSKNKKAEELNALAIGPWPAKGCLVISPWQGDKGKIIIWQGTIAETPQIATVNNFDKCLVLFKVSHKEKTEFRQKLIDEDYPNWPKNATRQKNLQFIRHCSEELIEAFVAEGLVKVSEETPQPNLVRCVL